MIIESLSVNDLIFHTKGPFSFKVWSHDCVGIRGRSGIGKTLLFKAIVDLIPFEGEIFCRGIGHAEVSAPEWRSMITLVLAESFWWYDTVGEHFPVTGQALTELLASLRRLGFDAEVLGWNVVQLSSGERQRLSLLRSLLKRPVVILLDEPTSSLDQYHTELVENFILEYSQKNVVPVIWVSHDDRQLDRVASRIFHMQENSLSEVV